MKMVEKNAKIIGTSLSRCIIQMVQKNISTDDVEVIFSGTMFDTALDAFYAYQELFEKHTGDAVKCAELLGKMWPKIVQPKKYGWTFRPLQENWWYPSYEAMQDYYNFHTGEKIIRMYDVLYARFKAKGIAA